MFDGLKYLSRDRSAAIKRAVLDREVNLSAPIYLLSAAVKSLRKKEVDRSEITEVHQHCIVHWRCLYSYWYNNNLYYNMQALLNISSSILDIPQTDRESRLELLEVL